MASHIQRKGITHNFGCLSARQVIQMLVGDLRYTFGCDIQVSTCQ